jgi:integral membrane sensor domain MASE1
VYVQHVEVVHEPPEPSAVQVQARRDSPARIAAELVALTVAYAVSARLGLALNAVSGFATLVWAPTGIALTALLLGGSRLWPGVAAGAIIANVLTGAPVWVALGIGTGNTLEAVLAASLLRRLHFEVHLERLRDVLALIVFAAGLSTLASATIGFLSLRAGGIVTTGHLNETWRAWWLGDALGDLVVASFLLTWSGPWRPGPVRPRRWIEGLALAAVTVGVTLFIFRLGAPLDPTPFRQAYMLFPVLIWAAIRFGPRGATATMLLSSAIAIWGTFLAHGPFAHPDASQSLFRLQAFMAVAAVTILVLAAAVAERREALQLREELLTIVSHDLRIRSGQS